MGGSQSEVDPTDTAGGAGQLDETGGTSSTDDTEGPDGGNGGTEVGSGGAVEVIDSLFPQTVPWAGYAFRLSQATTLSTKPEQENVPRSISVELHIVKVSEKLQVTELPHRYRLRTAAGAWLDPAGNVDRTFQLPADDGTVLQLPFRIDQLSDLQGAFLVIDDLAGTKEPLLIPWDEAYHATYPISVPELVDATLKTVSTPSLVTWDLRVMDAQVSHDAELLFGRRATKDHLLLQVTLGGTCNATAPFSCSLGQADFELLADGALIAPLPQLLPNNAELRTLVFEVSETARELALRPRMGGITPAELPFSIPVP